MTTAMAATFTVNSPADVPDANPGDGICETAAGNGICTLRAAVQESNKHANANTINLQANVTYLLSRVGVDDTALNGDLDILNSVTINGAGPGSTVIDGNGSVTGDRVFQIFPCFGGAILCDAGHAPIVVSMTGVTIQHGQSSNFAGGIFNSGSLALQNCVITSNIVSGVNDWGGGIYNNGLLTLSYTVVSNNATGSHNAHGGGIFNNGTLTITYSTISGNSTSSNVPNGTLGEGGGIYTSGLALDTTTVRNSTISGNSARVGGGIYNPGTTLNVINSTVSGNHSADSGGGISANAGTTGLYNTTVIENIANYDNAGIGIGGGVAHASGGTLTIANSIIALNENVVVTGGGNLLNYDDCAGRIASAGNNIMYAVDSGNCTVSGITIADPYVGPLQNNGGLTQTHALLTGSPAIDAGNSGGCTDNLGAPITTDQRGVHRPYGLACDIGAFEAAEIIFKNGFEQ